MRRRVPEISRDEFMIVGAVVLIIESARDAGVPPEALILVGLLILLLDTIIEES
jgi:hypothetical protein